MFIIIPLFIFCLGLIIGSFLNVVILRLNTGRSIAKGRSHCARCNHILGWHELIPVFSFLFLKGKCKTCRQNISFQYPIVELITGILFVLAYSFFVVPFGLSVFSWIVFAFSTIVSSLLTVIFVYDLRHKVIPNSMVYPFIVMSLISVFFKMYYLPKVFWFKLLIAGPIIAAPFFLIWLISKGRAMGFGDVKLALGIGWLVGIVGGIFTLVLSFWIGGFVGIFLLILSKKYNLRSEIAFAPFLILALAIVVFSGIDFSSIIPVSLWL